MCCKNPQLKTEYREKYGRLKELQACVKIVKQYMDRSRSKLLSEFAEWFKVCYVGGESSVGEEEPSGEINQKVKHISMCSYYTIIEGFRIHGFHGLESNLRILIVKGVAKYQQSMVWLPIHEYFPHESLC